MKNLKKLLIGFFSVLALMILNSCTKDSTASNGNTPTTPTGQDVYIAGYNIDTIKQIKTPTYWKNGIAFSLPVTGEHYNTTTTGICVVGNDVYVSGVDYGRPLYWKNGVPVYLAENGETSGIVAVGNDVYVSGTVTNPSGIYVPTYWKNGIATYLPVTYNRPGLRGQSSGIAVSGNTVYVSGHEDINAGTNNSFIQAKYWRNGVVTNLTNQTISNVALANDIAIAGNDVFVAGTLDYQPVYWRNGVVTYLEGSQANAISVVGNDVYVFGFNQTATGNTAVYWKNGISTNLSDGSSYTALVDGTVVGNDIFAISASSDSWGGFTTAKYWKNNTATIIGGSGAVLTSIFVTTN